MVKGFPRVTMMLQMPYFRNVFKLYALSNLLGGILIPTLPENDFASTLMPDKHL